MKISLVNPSAKGFVPIIPIGVIYLQSYLIYKNHQCNIIDMNFENSIMLEEKLKAFSPDLIGISVRNIAETDSMNSIYDELKTLVECSQQYSKVVFGGAGFSICPSAIMNYCCADYGIIGPGETAIEYLVNNLQTIERNTILKVDDTSFIYSDISDAMKIYWDKYGKYHYLCNSKIPIQTTRGCKYGCRYCTYSNVANGRIQSRPVSSVLSELKKIIKITATDNIYFVDSVLNMDLSYFKELLSSIIIENVNCKWFGCINPNEYDAEMIRLMKNSGCKYCEIGIDSFSDFQLYAMGKKYDSINALTLIEYIEAADIDYSISLILGGYGETLDTLEETVNIMKKLKNTKINIFIGERVYPHTKLSNMLNLDSEEKLIFASDKTIYISSEVAESLRGMVNSNVPSNWNFIGIKD